MKSFEFKEQVTWFSTLVSKKTTLPILKRTLKKFPGAEVQIIEMTQGQKVSRLFIWRFVPRA